MPSLCVFSGPPASGKSTLARAVSRAHSAAHLRIDTIEQALIDLFDAPLDGRGHAFAARLAADNLRNGVAVVIDACNLHPDARAMWPPLAAGCGVPLVVVEVRCSNEAEHRRRVQTRRPDPPNLALPLWPEVRRRARAAIPWNLATVRHDSAGLTEAASIAAVLGALAAADPPPARSC